MASGYRSDAGLELSDVAMCYFAALIEGLRLINEKCADRPDLEENFDAGALVQYVQVKGQQIAQLCYPGDDYEKAEKRTAIVVIEPPKHLRTQLNRLCRPYPNKSLTK